MCELKLVSHDCHNTGLMKGVGVGERVMLRYTSHDGLVVQVKLIPHSTTMQAQLAMQKTEDLAISIKPEGAKEPLLAN